jgi:serine/threonine protein phosphatase PrpC
MSKPTYSGTTACVVLLRDDRLYVSNCGDSRAVLAKRGTTIKKKTGTTKMATEDDERRTTDDSCGNGLIAIQLSTDQNPDSPGEKERILSLGGYVTPPPEPGLSSRVWLDRGHTQIGLAMARSIGDHAVKGVGVIARPVVTTRVIDWAADDFIIVATDGVWEFLSSEDAVDIVGRHLYGETADDDNDDGKSRGHDDDYADRDEACSGGIGGGDWGASAACKALIKAASEKWHEHEGDYRDDITAIVIRLKDLWGR